MLGGPAVDWPLLSLCPDFFADKLCCVGRWCVSHKVVDSARDAWDCVVVPGFWLFNRCCFEDA
jgi:hypothetical protein